MEIEVFPLMGCFINGIPVTPKMQGFGTTVLKDFARNKQKYGFL